MKPEALTLALFIALACCTHQRTTADTLQHGNAIAICSADSVSITDSVRIQPPDSTAHVNVYTDSLATMPMSERCDSVVMTAYTLSKQFVRDFGHTTVDVFCYPFTSWENRDYVKSTILVGVTGLTYTMLDDPIKEWAQRTRNNHSAFFSTKLQFVGQGYVAAGIIATFEVYGLAFKQKKARRVAVLSAESFLISTGISTAMKYLAGRARPNTGADHDQWYGPQLTHKSQTSFFSGHTTAIFSMATVVALEYSNHKWVPPTIYSLAVLAAASRIHDNKHWASDVVFAALLSHYIAKTVVRLHKKMGNKFYLAPEIGGNYNGLAMRYCF